MRFYSTNQSIGLVSLQEAVLTGLPADNGLFMPEVIPTLPDHFFDEIDSLTFSEISLEVANAFLKKDLTKDTIEEIVKEAINFEAPLVEVEKNTHALELFHGPTLAFKDFGARFMSRLMAHFIRNQKEELTILVATSGDTGSAVANGFYNVPGIHIKILYPKGKVSDIQEKQLTTLGGNITALEIDGTFDDCQRLVKQAFLDDELKAKLRLSSANSINIARLIPQSFYYFNAYAQLKQKGLPVCFAVPSGNFGNLTAGLIAKRMGLPVQQFIAATNINDVIPEYLQTGKYKARPSVQTISNAMDVGAPSNFARMLDLYDSDVEKMRSDITGYYFSDEATRLAMRKVYKECDYTLDPHGAVAYLGLKAFKKESSAPFSGVFFETAHPAKFKETVEEEIKQEVQIPARLQQCVDKKKEAIALANDYSSLKELLLS